MRRKTYSSDTSTTALPTIAIVGRPNVGKSTLFNRLVKRRRAIVGDEPGITRDRLYGDTEWRGRTLRVVDTGGILPEDKDLMPAAIYEQAQVALDEAAAVVLVVDARTELASPDLELARRLRIAGKPLFLAVNKVDTPKMEADAEEFRRLGIPNLFPLSAENGTGVAELLDAILEVLPVESFPAPPAVGGFHVDPAMPDEPSATGNEKREMPASPAVGGFHGDPVIPDEPPAAENEERETPNEVRVAIIGRPNVGKSTLLNALTGSGRAIVSPVPGTTRDAVDELVVRDGMSYRFIDTAGIRRKGKTKLMAEKLSVVMARKHLEAADIALMVVDATEGVTALDATIAGYAHESGRSVIVIVNKWDLVATATDGGSAPAGGAKARGRHVHDRAHPADRGRYEQRVRDALKFLDYAPLVFTSAVKGTHMDKIFQQVALVARERRKRIPTAEMNRFLKSVDFERATVPGAHRVKIYYLTQAAVSPPTFILFTDRKVKLHFSYLRFVQNQIRKAFGFIGTPIWIKTRASE